MGDSNQRFLEANRIAPKRWERFDLELTQGAKGIPYNEVMTPFFGTRLFHRFSPAQLLQLHRDFIVFNAEAVAVFEQLLLVAFRAELRQTSETSKVRVRLSPIRSDVICETSGARKMLREEYIHLKAFRRFLRTERSLNWPRRSVFLKGQRKLRNLMVWILRKSPLSILLPGARLETYTLFYSSFVLKNAPESRNWKELNRLHMLDESHHVPFAYGYYDGEFPYALKDRWRLRFYTVIFTLCIQALAMNAWIKMAGRLMYGASRASKTWLGLRGFIWTVRRFQPWIETRKRVRAHLKEERLAHSGLFSFLHR